MKSIFTWLIFSVLFISFSFGQDQKVDFYTIDHLAKTHAAEDAKANALGWGLGSFGASLMFSPLLGGGVTIAIAYGSKGDTAVPSMRVAYINDQYGMQGFSHYNSVYTTERGKIQKKGNGRAALGGAGACFALFFAIIMNAASDDAPSYN